MNYKEHTRLDLVAGGNVFKQGDHMTLGFTPRDYEGDVVDLTGKDIEGVIYSRRKGIMFTAPADYVTAEQKIEFTIDEVLDHGEFQIEFTVTDASDPEYRRKFPSAEQDGRLIIKPSADNMDVVGVQMTTVSQLKNELQGLQSDFAGQVLPRVDTVEGKQMLLEKQFDAAAGALTEDSEVAAARMGRDSLVAFNREVSTQLAETVKKDETGVLDLNVFDEPTRAVLQGLEPGQINAVLGRKNVTLENIAFAKESTNLYNKVTSKNGFYLSTTTGNEVAGSGFTSSDFIPVSPSTSYYTRVARRVVYYDANKAFISSDPDTTAKQNYVITTPANAAYMRLSWGTSDTAEEQQVNKGNVKLPYEPYYVLINRNFVEKPVIETSDLPPLAIENLGFSKLKSNLFDKTKARMNFYISNTSGSLVAGTNFVVSDFIPVEPIKSYILKTARHYALYDQNKVFVSGRPTSEAAANLVVNIPSNVRFIRFSWYLPSDFVTLDEQQMNEGTQLLPYEPFGYQIPRDYLEIPKGSAAGKVAVNLPPEIYVVTGKEINIYFQNVVNVPLKDYQVDVTCSLGKHYQDRWTATPTASGTHVITIALYKDFEMVAQGNSTVVVKSATVGTGVTKNAIVIGDSTIAQDYLINHLEDTLATDPLTVNLMGTLGTYGELHNEGRAGWTMADYRTNKTYNDVANPFFNPATNDFDFTYYMSNRSFGNIDYVGLCLGINDTFPFTSDSALLDAIPKVLNDFDVVVNSILAYNSNIKVGICVTIPPNESQDAFGDAYNNGQTQWRYKRNNALWVEQLIAKYRGKSGQRIYLIPDNTNINAKTGFRDGVHPNQEVGDKQRADTFYYWLKSFES